MDAESIVRALGLEPLPREGGYFTETYASGEKLPASALPARYAGARPFGTAIYYLLTPETSSAIHRLKSDEVWHFYAGDPVTMLQLLEDGSSQSVTLGCRLDRGELPQCVVPHGVWQGACLADGGRFALMGTTMAPGYDEADFELGDRGALLARYPSQYQVIHRLTGR